MDEESFEFTEDYFYTAGVMDAAAGNAPFRYRSEDTSNWQFVYDAGYEDYMESIR